LAILKRRDNNRKFEQGLHGPLIVGLKAQADVTLGREIGAMEKNPAHIALVTRGFAAIIFRKSMETAVRGAICTIT
jgi:hypothetical protein